MGSVEGGPAEVRCELIHKLMSEMGMMELPVFTLQLMALYEEASGKQCLLIFPRSWAGEQLEAHVQGLMRGT